MDDIQLNEILSSYRDAINALIERIDAQDSMIKALTEKCDGLDHLIFDEVVNPAKEALDQYNYNTGLNEFTNKYGEQLAGYNDYEGEKPDEDLYVEELIKSVDYQLDDIRKAIGAPADAEIEVVDNGEGKPEIEVDGKPVTSEGDTTEEVSTEIVENDENGETSDPEELAELEKELLAYAK